MSKIDFSKAMLLYEVLSNFELYFATKVQTGLWVTNEFDKLRLS